MDHNFDCNQTKTLTAQDLVKLMIPLLVAQYVGKWWKESKAAKYD
jgi:hypothetical protein